MVEFYFSDKFTTIMNAVYDYVKLADEKVREIYEKIRQKDEEPAWWNMNDPIGDDDELIELLEERTPKIRDFYESNDNPNLFSMPQDISESRFGIGLLLEKERYNFNLKQLFKSNDTIPLIRTWLGINNKMGLSEIYKDFQVELITLYVCRIFFNDNLILQSSEIDYLNPNGWDKWNRKFGFQYVDVISLLDEKYSELKKLLDTNAPNNIINWEQGSEFEGAYTRISGSGGGDSGRRSFSYIPLWLLLNNIQSIYSDSQYPKFEMGQKNEILAQRFVIDFEYLMASRGLRRTIMNRIKNLPPHLLWQIDEEGNITFSDITLDDNGNIMGKTTLETIDWVRNKGLEIKATQEYSLDFASYSSALQNLMWLDAEKLGTSRRGVDTAYLRAKRKYNILLDGKVIDKWNAGDDSWSFGLTGQFSISPPDTPNKLYQSLEYKITGLISNYLVLKPINYPKGLYIKLPSQEE